MPLARECRRSESLLLRGKNPRNEAVAAERDGCYFEEKPRRFAEAGLLSIRPIVELQETDFRDVVELNNIQPWASAVSQRAGPQ